MLCNFLHCYNLYDPFKCLIYYCAHDEVSCQNFWEVPALVKIREVALDLIKGPGKTLIYSRLYAVLGKTLIHSRYLHYVSLTCNRLTVDCM